MIKESNYLFPLESLLPEYKTVEIPTLGKKMILTKTDLIPHDLMIELEKAGVYEVDDFLSLTVQNIKSLGITQSDFELIKENLLQSTQASNPILPEKSKLTSDNFCIIGLEETPTETLLLCYWRGLLTCITTDDESFLTLKSKFFEILDLMEHPEIIVYQDDELPSWISNEADHYSTYFSTQQFAEDIIFDNKRLEKYFHSNLKVYSQNIIAIAYLLDHTGNAVLSKNRQVPQIQ